MRATRVRSAPGKRFSFRGLYITVRDAVTPYELLLQAVPLKCSALKANEAWQGAPAPTEGIRGPRFRAYRPRARQRQRQSPGLTWHANALTDALFRQQSIWV